MNTSAKIWIIIAVLLIVLGGTALLIIMSANNWNFSELGTESFKTVTNELTEQFDNIQINSSTADIVFTTSNSENCTITFYERENAQYTAEITNNTLTVNAVDTQKWYEHISFSFQAPKITVALPRSEYASVYIDNKTGNIEVPNGFIFKSIDLQTSTGNITCCAAANEAIRLTASTGDIKLNNITAESIKLSVTTGNITLASSVCNGAIELSVKTGASTVNSVSCKSLTSNGSTGTIRLENVIASDYFSIERSAGNVKFSDCDASSITVKTSTGNVTGTLLTDKIFIAKTSTGNISVPSTVTGGKCEITTSTGDISIELVKNK